MAVNKNMSNMRIKIIKQWTSDFPLFSLDENMYLEVCGEPRFVFVAAQRLWLFLSRVNTLFVLYAVIIPAVADRSNFWSIIFTMCPVFTPMFWLQVCKEDNHFVVLFTRFHAPRFAQCYIYNILKLTAFE